MKNKVFLKPMISPRKLKGFDNIVKFNPIESKRPLKIQTGDVINQFINFNVKDVRIKTTKSTLKNKLIPPLKNVETDFLFSLTNKILPK